MTEQKLTTWPEIRANATATRRGRVIDINELPSITGIPEGLAEQIRNGYNLFIDYTGRPTLQQRLTNSDTC